MANKIFKIGDIKEGDLVRITQEDIAILVREPSFFDNYIEGEYLHGLDKCKFVGFRYTDIFESITLDFDRVSIYVENHSGNLINAKTVADALCIDLTRCVEIMEDIDGLSNKMDSDYPLLYRIRL